MPRKTSNIDSLLEEIGSQLKRQNSLRYIFLQGLLRGLGTAFGATVLVALVTSLAIQFSDSGEVISFMKSVITSISD